MILKKYYDIISSKRISILLLTLFTLSILISASLSSPTSAFNASNNKTIDDPQSSDILVPFFSQRDNQCIKIRTR